MSSVFKGPEAFQPATGEYGLLPFRFARLDARRYVAVNEVGEWQVMGRADLESLVRKTLPRSAPLFHSLKSKHFVRETVSDVAADLLALKVRSKRHRAAEFTGLHMFVVTLRCNHTCQYCQVSRQNEDRGAFNMTEAMADRAVDFVFRSPSKSLKIEFQGGEPLLNFGLIRYIVMAVEERNRRKGRDVAFVVATNLSLLDDAMLEFFREHRVCISTSLDGPEDLHNANRPKTGSNSHQTAIAGIERARDALGHERVGALMTTTAASLPRAKEIVDEYVNRGFNEIFLRSLSPYGFAIKTKCFNGYDADEWLAFYREALDHIIEINRRGRPFVERYSAIILQKMLTPHGTGFVNLQSPAGLGIAGIIYNYNGEVYPSDEARMKAEMGDKVFRMGNLLTDGYEDVMLSPAQLNPLVESVAEASPMCSECAFLPYCGSDPDYHYATQGDFVGHKALSGFCRKHMGIFRHLIQRMEDDPEARRILEGWVQW